MTPRQAPLRRSATLRLAGAALLLALTAPAMAAEKGGDAFGLSGHRGRVLLVNFWATWCAPCRGEMPALDAALQRHKGDGLDMLVISMDDPSKAKKAAAFAGQFSFTAVMAADTSIPPQFRPSQLPVTLIFGRDGQLRFDSRKSPGLMTADRLETLLAPLLAGR